MTMMCVDTEHFAPPFPVSPASTPDLGKTPTSPCNFNLNFEIWGNPK